jgi:hypothetical protein
MITDNANRKLYSFDNIAGQKTGAISTSLAQRTVWKSDNQLAVYSKCGESNPNSASRAIDGRTDRFWQHESTDNHWIVLDMGQAVDITQIRIYQSGTSSEIWGQSGGIEVYVSNDPTNWGPAVWTGTLNSPNWQYSATFSKLGRYVKLYSRSNSSLQKLYEVEVQITEKQSTIEFNPVERYSASFTYPLDVTWHGAVPTFVNEPIYPTSGNIGIWAIVEYPPTVSVE